MANERLTMVMEPLISGCSAVVMVGGGDDATRLYGRKVETDGSYGPATELAILQRTDECFTVDIPDGPHTAWWLAPAPDVETPGSWLTNFPRLDWADRPQVAPGDCVRIYGRNLVTPDHYPTEDPHSPVSYGGWHQDATEVVAVAADGTRIPLAVEKANAYEVHLTLPANVAPGVLNIVAHNGLGGALGWSEPLQITVHAVPVESGLVIRVEERFSEGCDVDALIETALAELSAAGGGVLEFGPFNYAITRTIVLPPHTTLRGAGRERTLLNLPYKGGAESCAMSPWIGITGDGPFALEDLCVRGVYAAALVCAPTFLPETADESVELEIAIGLGEKRARDIALRRCRIEQHPLKQTMRRKDVDPRDRFKKYSERGWGGGLEDKQAAVYVKTDGMIVEDSVVLGGGEGVFLNRCTAVRISRNTLKAGHFGAAIHSHSRLTWPASGGGAPIEGNYSREVVIEDNDISARSEFARNLVVFSFGGANLHMARNNIHGIEPTCDSEALMTHLWQARWTTPTIEMLDPTHARIIDPEGEVADEWLTDAWIDVVEGRGLGQLRKIVKREGDQIVLDRPWHCEPDATSKLVFTAPVPFRNVTILDNRIVSDAVNLIIWGMAWDNVVDGNTTVGGPGITIWSVRLAPDQKVWGGCSYISVINNVTEQGWAATRDEKHAVGSAVGIFTIGSKYDDVECLGPDYLGLIVRNNHTLNDAGIGMRSTGPWGWKMKTLGVVVERNHASSSAVGVAVEAGMRAVVRDNTADADVAMPLVLDGGPA